MPSQTVQDKHWHALMQDKEPVEQQLLYSTYELCFLTLNLILMNNKSQRMKLKKPVSISVHLQSRANNEVLGTKHLSRERMMCAFSELQARSLLSKVLNKWAHARRFFFFFVS